MLEFWLPHVAKAAADLSVLRNFILKVETVILNPVIKLGFAIALVLFLYGVFQFIANAESKESRQQGARHILWGILGMFIMVAAGGIMRVICGSWGLQNPSSCNPF